MVHILHFPITTKCSRKKRTKPIHNIVEFIGRHMRTMKKKRLLLASLSIVASLGLAGCSSMFTKHVEWETIEPVNYPVLTAVGYAPINAQLASDGSSKTLMAIKASKLDAYRELAEQVFGQKVDGEQELANLILTNNQLKSSVEGVIRGARVVKSYPVGEDTYATELELDMSRVYDIYLSTAKPKKIRKVTYY